MVSSGSSAAPFGASPETLLDVAVAIAENGAGRVPTETLTEAARESAPLITQVEPAKVRAGLEAVILGRSLEEALQWMHQAGLLAVLAARARGDGRLLAGGGAAAQGRLGAHQAGRAAVGAAAARALGGAAARHRQGADADLHARRRRALPPARRGGRAHVRRRGAAASLRHADERQKIRFLILHHLRPNQYERSWTDSAVRRFDREMERAPRRPARPVARGHHVARGRVAARRRWRNINALKSASWRIRGRREGAAVADRDRQRDHGGVQPAAVAADRRHPQAVLEVAVESGELEARRDAAYYIDFLRKSGVTE